MKKINYVVDFLVNKIIILIAIMSVVAFYVPGYFAWMTNYTSIFLGLAMFGMGTTISLDNLKNVVKNPKSIFIGIFAQFVFMPLIAWILCKMLNLPREIALGVILVGACPGGTASNVISHIAGADVALSVSMTIVSTLLAPVLTPLLVYLLAGTIVEVSLAAMFVTVVKVILVPVVLGILINRLLGEKMQNIRPVLPLVSSLSIILIISGIVALNANKILQSGLIVTAVVFLHNIIGLLAGLGFSRIFKLGYDQESAVAIEVGMQNSGLAVSLATVNFAASPLATLPGAIFSVVHNLTGTVFAIVRKNRKVNQETNKDVSRGEISLTA